MKRKIYSIKLHYWHYTCWVKSSPDKGEASHHYHTTPSIGKRAVYYEELATTIKRSIEDATEGVFVELVRAL
jgi:hypothetical protein